MTEMSEKKLTLSDIDKMNVTELTEELKKKNLDSNGNKAQLKFRLMSNIEIEDVDEQEKDNDDDDNTSFCSAGQIEITPQVKNLSFRDIEDTIEHFSGDESVMIEKWLKDVEEIRELTKWSEYEIVLCAKRLLNGSAKKFIKSQQNINSWARFKSVMIDEFKISVNSRDVHDKLQKRKKKWNESWREYIYEMTDIAKQINLEENVLVSYIVDGIEDTSSDKLVLCGAHSIKELKYKFEEYERIKHNKTKVINKNKDEKRTNSINVRRCYNCNKMGHEAAKCRNNEKGPKCFNCQEYGHISTNCKKGKPEIVKCCEWRDNKKSQNYIKIEFKNLYFDALVDTGSQANLIRDDVFEKAKVVDFDQCSETFIGFGGAKIEAKFVFKDNIRIQNEDYCLTFYVVPKKSMNTSIIIGNDIIQQAELTIQPDKITFKKLKENEVVSTNFSILKIDIVDDTDVDVPVKYKPEINKMIKNYEPNKAKITKVETKIILTDELPVYSKPRRLAPLEKNILNEQIQEWLEEGIIVPSVSDFSSPVVIVKKKTGDYRVCIDYRRLNKKIIKDRFPMPVIEDQLSKLAGAKVFSVLDLKNGFFHVPVAVDSRKYTAFSTADNQYEFTKTPFGLCNSPASFGRFINDVIRDLIKNGVVIQYVDDLIIPSEDEAEGIKKLKMVLEVAAEYSLIIQWKKCKFLQRSVEYLGHVVENSHIKPSPNKVKAVVAFPQPKSVKQIQSFLGLSGFFRKFIPNYSKIAVPLTKLLKKESVFSFGKEEEEAFTMLKTILSTEPVLRIYNTNADTEVHTDACQDGIGAVLLQKQPIKKELHPVFYMSKTTSPHEKRYHSYELEVLAVVTAVKKFRPYLLGLKFKIVTDCAAFQKTVNKADVPNRVARWTLLLEEYDYVIEHRSGQRMKHVDALSRNSVMVVENALSNIIKASQDKDERILVIKKLVEKGEYEDYSIQNGVLMKYVNGKDVVVVPVNLERDLIRRVHENGHFGTKKMQEIIKRDYFIPNLTKKLEHQMQCCVECILGERKKGKKEGKLYPIPKDDFPLGTYHVDHLGPLSSTGKGYCYLFVVIDAFSKFTWIYPTKTTNTKEVLDKLELQAKTFGNPARIISDRGTAFTSGEFQKYCEEKYIEHTKITTGVPRSNGQVERQNQVIISVLTKLSAEDPSKWFRHVDKVQRCLNATYQRSLNTSPFEVLVGVKMKDDLDVKILDILEEEKLEIYQESRECLRRLAKENIIKIQEEQKRGYDKKRKEAKKYNVGDIVAIKRTQFGTGMKLRGKFLGPYTVTSIIGKDRYELKKLYQGEGPNVTSSAADLMKPWYENSSGSDDQ